MALTRNLVVLSKRLSLRSATAILLVLLACNPPRFSNPLSDPRTAKADPRLVGVWNADMKNEKVTITVVADVGASVDLVLVGDHGSGKGAEVGWFHAFPSVISGKTYLNVKAKRRIGDFGSDKTETDKEGFFLRYEVNNEALTLWVMDGKEVKAAVALGTLKGSVDTEEDVHVTSDTGTLANFVKNANDAKLFRKLGTFRRQR